MTLHLHLPQVCVRVQVLGEGVYPQSTHGAHTQVHSLALILALKSHFIRKELGHLVPKNSRSLLVNLHISSSGLWGLRSFLVCILTGFSYRAHHTCHLCSMVLSELEGLLWNREHTVTNYPQV